MKGIAGRHDIMVSCLELVEVKTDGGKNKE